MRDILIQATDVALSSITQPRYYRSERGFQGRFYYLLQAELEAAQITDADTLLEMEYQKRALLQGTRQRPDIILHVPTEHSGQPRDQNNHCVWALKLRASPDAAQEDFRKLDEMFDHLAYQLGIFVNLASGRHWVEEYTGIHKTRILGVSVLLRDGMATTSWSGK